MVRAVLGAALGTMLGLLFGVMGYIAGWFVAMSLAVGVVEMPHLVTSTGIGAGVGVFLGWWDLEGSARERLLALSVAVVGAVGGAWGGFTYGSTIEPVSRNLTPAIAATIFGAVIGGNVALLAWNIGRELRSRRQ